MKNTIYLATVLFLISIGAGAPQTTSQGDPGFIGASHPLHQVEVVTDNLAISFGFANASEVAEERLAEANQAAVQGKEKAQGKALNQYNKIAERARNLGDNQNIQGMLEQVQERTPENASNGLRNTLDNAGNVTSNVPDDVVPGEAETNLGQKVGNMGMGIPG